MRALPVEPTDYTFVDVGAGKGKAVLLAARRSFREVVGVELDVRLAATAKRNLEQHRPRRRAGSVKVACGDATEFAWPGGPLVIYFFNPFSESVLETVLAKVRQSASINRRPIVVAYTAPSRRYWRRMEADPHYRLNNDHGHTAVFELVSCAGVGKPGASGG